MRQLWRRLNYVWHRRRYEAELAEEMAHHAALSGGKAFGSVALAQNRARDVWIWPWLQEVAQDFRFAVRMLAKDRRFTFTALVALSLGIAANNTVFTFINTALFKDLPFERPRQIVAIGTRDLRGREVGMSYLDFQELRRSARGFTELSASAGFAATLSDEQRAPERFRGTYLPANTFELLRVKPMLGRSFVLEDEVAGATPVVILGDGVWKSRYGGDAAIIGRTIRVNEVPSTVIGVMPPGFAFPGTAEVWQPLALLPGLTTARRDARTLSVIGRLRDEVTIPQARADLETIFGRLAHEYPDTNRGMTATVTPPFESARRFMRPQLMTLMGAVGFVLLIACANVANLLLARAAQRSREIAIRASLGATRWRIVRQLLIESVLLAALSGAVGLWLSIYSIRYFGVAFDAIETGAPDRMATPYWINLSMDAAVFAFVAALCLGSSIVFGLAPALHISKTDVNDVLKESGRHAVGSIRARRWTGALMVFELSLTLILLSGAGLLVRSFLALYHTNLVIDVSQLWTGRLALPIQKYPTPESRAAFFSRLETRFATNPTPLSVTLASDIPLATLGGSLRQLSIEGHPDPSEEPLPGVSYVSVGQHYFDTVGLRLERGRAFLDDDSKTDRRSAVINQRLASMFFANADPLGQIIRIVAPGTPPRAAVPLTIVGVVATLPQFGPRELSPEPAVYVPLAAEPSPGRLLSIIARGPGTTVTTRLIRDDVRALDADLAPWRCTPFRP
jgi:predicted permease